MSRNTSVKRRLNKILDEIERDSITTDTVKEAWLDQYGCRMLPHANRLAVAIKVHERWIPAGGFRSHRTVYIRRVKA
jgi:hypothetical protein